MNPRPRVVHFVDSEIFGGAEQAILTLLAGTDRARWDLVLAHYPANSLAQLIDGARALGVETWAVPAMHPGLRGVRRLPGFASELRRRRPAIVHLHLTWPLGCQYALIGAVLARVPVVVATVQLNVDLTLNRRVMWQQQLLTRAVDRYLAVSESLRRNLVRDLHWPGNKIVVVPNAIGTQSASSAVPPSLRSDIVRDTTTPLVLVPARLHPQKGHRYLLRAIVDVPAAHFAFAGDGPERGALEALACELGVAGRVSFLGHRDDMPALLAVCDVVVLPSLYEGLPVSLIEAMAAAKPVIATRIAGTDELITSGHDGVLVEPKDPNAIATAVQALLDDREAAQRLAECARRTVVERFAAHEMCRRVTKVYDELLAG